jgi:hypothetical protein
VLGVTSLAQALIDGFFWWVKESRHRSAVFGTDMFGNDIDDESSP